MLSKIFKAERTRDPPLEARVENLEELRAGYGDLQRTLAALLKDLTYLAKHEQLASSQLAEMGRKCVLVSDVEVRVRCVRE